jgi:hypothetical protein
MQLRRRAVIERRVWRGAGQTRLTGQTTTARFTAFQVLTGTTANRALVTLTGAHPTARIDTSTADYNAASKRLQP